MPITQLTADAFADFTSGSTPVLVDFYAEGCAPCRKMSAVLEDIAAARPAMPVGKVNVEAEPDLANAYVVRSIPTLLLWKNGELTDRWTGETPAGAILAAIDTGEAAPAGTNALRDDRTMPHHTMPRLYSDPLSGLPCDDLPGTFHDLQDTWRTW